jgi:hypothetical protein
MSTRSQQRGWEVHGVNSSSDPMLLYVYAYCAPGISSVRLSAFGQKSRQK